MLETETQFGNDINEILECYGIENSFINLLYAILF